MAALVMCAEVAGMAPLGGCPGLALGPAVQERQPTPVGAYLARCEPPWAADPNWPGDCTEWATGGNPEERLEEGSPWSTLEQKTPAW